jgi:small multidrug resistance family-3 protein
MPTAAAYLGAALAEVAGRFAFWAWLRLDRSAWWLLPETASLALFRLPARPGRERSRGPGLPAYDGVHIAASLGWLWLVEGARPGRWDLAGAAPCLLGAGVILLGPRPA